MYRFISSEGEGKEVAILVDSSVEVMAGVCFDIFLADKTMPSPVQGTGLGA